MRLRASLPVCLAFLFVVLVDSTNAYLPPFPPLWAGAPNGTTGLEHNEVNAWNYTHRLAMYKQILLGSKGHCLWREHALGNPVWGLPLQHGWQEYSGRLCINGSQGELAMRPTCWWACANCEQPHETYLTATDPSCLVA